MKKPDPESPPGGPPGDLDKTIHEPARLLLMTTLFVLESADFLFLLNQTGLTRGNLSVHLQKLESAGFLNIVKGYSGRRPNTNVRLTESGRAALIRYREKMERLLSVLPRSTDEP